jgi:hypothetical protein
VSDIPEFLIRFFESAKIMICPKVSKKYEANKRYKYLIVQKHNVTYNPPFIPPLVFDDFTRAPKKQRGGDGEIRLSRYKRD